MKTFRRGALGRCWLWHWRTRPTRKCFGGAFATAFGVDAEKNFLDWSFMWRDVVRVAKLAGMVRLFVRLAMAKGFSRGLFSPSAPDGCAVRFVPVDALLLSV